MMRSACLQVAPHKPSVAIHSNEVGTCQHEAESFVSRSFYRRLLLMFAWRPKVKRSFLSLHGTLDRLITSQRPNTWRISCSLHGLVYDPTVAWGDDFLRPESFLGVPSISNRDLPSHHAHRDASFALVCCDPIVKLCFRPFLRYDVPTTPFLPLPSKRWPRVSSHRVDAFLLPSSVARGSTHVKDAGTFERWRKMPSKSHDRFSDVGIQSEESEGMDEGVGIDASARKSFLF